VIHELKTWPESYRALVDGVKTHEVRSTQDRQFNAGDQLLLHEFIPCKKCLGSGGVREYTEVEHCCSSPHGEYTGRSHTFNVTFVTKSGEFGVPEGLCVMSVSSADDPLPYPYVRIVSQRSV
jgi:hypothetical protein